MLIQILFICLFPTIVLAEAASNVVVNVYLPRAVSPEAFYERVINFWTPDRLKAAEMLDVTLSGSAVRAATINSSVLTGNQSSFEGSLPSGNESTTKTVSNNGRQVFTTGRVFWNVGSSGYSCSAAVVVSKTGDVVSTARHCVYDTTTKAWYINSNWVFVPAYYNGNAPYGVWPARSMMALQAWLTSADKNYDVAFVALSTLSGSHIQSVVGSQGIGFNFPRNAFTYALGYPVNLYNGLYLQLCSGYAQNSQWTQGNYVGQGLSCIMGGGCSGGPWLQGVNDATGIGYVTSVNSFTITTVNNVINGPYFDSSTQMLYNSATSM